MLSSVGARIRKTLPCVFVKPCVGPETHDVPVAVVALLQPVTLFPQASYFISLRDCGLVTFWQNGSDYNDEFFTAAIADDGSVVMAGHTEGNWNAANADGPGKSRYFAAAKIDADGVLLWKWHVISYYNILKTTS